MGSVVKKVVIGFAVAAVLAGLGYAAYVVVVPHLTGANHEVPSDTGTNPIYVMRWMMRGVDKDEPQKVWNGMTIGFRAKFVSYFNKVRRGEAPSEAWEKVAKDVGLASSRDGLVKLDDSRMFRVWWRLDDRGVVGFRLPAFMRKHFEKRPEIVLEKTFWDADPEKASKNYIQYTVDGVTDLMHFVRGSEGWRLEILDDVPDGM